MQARDARLAAFVDAIGGAVASLPESDDARPFLDKCLTALAEPGEAASRPGAPIAATAHLTAAFARAGAGPAPFARLAATLKDLEPAIVWRRRQNATSVPGPFAEGHGSTTLIGPDPNDAPLELHPTVRVGVSLVAPGVTYPDHRHPPEEAYLVLSDGDWRQRANPWTARGPGGTVHNPPDIVHAMRAGPDAPLLAIWLLWMGD